MNKLSFLLYNNCNKIINSPFRAFFLNKKATQPNIFNQSGQFIISRCCSGNIDGTARHNFNENCEELLNKQINIELYNSYVYQSMAFYFDRDDQALPGFHKYFKKSAADEYSHAVALMYYQNKRGGRIVLFDIKKPEKDDWGTGLEAMESALELEKATSDSLMELHRVAERHGDVSLCGLVEHEFLQEQVSAIKELADHIRNLKRVGPGLGKYKFDRETLGRKYDAVP